jgi:hypothetical protein
MSQLGSITIQYSKGWNSHFPVLRTLNGQGTEIRVAGCSLRINWGVKLWLQLWLVHKQCINKKDPHFYWVWHVTWTCKGEVSGNLITTSVTLSSFHLTMASTIARTKQTFKKTTRGPVKHGVLGNSAKTQVTGLQISIQPLAVKNCETACVKVVCPQVFCRWAHAEALNI